jgi:glutamine cyclotransferase
MNNFFIFSFIFLCFLSLDAYEIEQLSLQIIKEYPHNTKNFTQGLAISDHYLYESSGLYGRSNLKKLNLKSNEIIKEFSLPKKYFAEGIAHCGNQLILVTWKEHKAFVFEPQSLELINEFTYPGEGWGLCFDGSAIWMSDGSDRLYRRNLNNFAIEKTLTVKAGNQTFNRLNDLVCVDGSIYANVWCRNIILRIDKETGQVTGIIDASKLLSDKQKSKLAPEAVLNGITYRPETQTFFVTGKFWPVLFEVRFIKKS